MSTRHKRTPKGRFVLRGDSIRPYSGESKGEIEKVIKKMLFSYRKI